MPKETGKTVAFEKQFQRNSLIAVEKKIPNQKV